MIDWLFGVIDVLLNWALYKVITPFIFHLQNKWHYVIPPDTTRDRVVYEHTFLNIIAMAADLICAILILVGLRQRIVTYVGLMAIAMCILSDQGKIYSDQYKLLSNNKNVCLIKGKEWKYMKKYTPSLGRAIVAAGFIVVFLMLAMINLFQNDFNEPNVGYYIAMSVMLVVMMWIKLKCYFTSTFMLKDCIIKKREEV